MGKKIRSRLYDVLEGDTREAGEINTGVKTHNHHLVTAFSLGFLAVIVICLGLFLLNEPPKAKKGANEVMMIKENDRSEWFRPPPGRSGKEVVEASTVSGPKGRDQSTLKNGNPTDAKKGKWSQNQGFGKKIQPAAPAITIRTRSIYELPESFRERGAFRDLMDEYQLNDPNLFPTEPAIPLNLEEISRAIEYPAVAEETGIEGDIWVGIVVDETGTYDGHHMLSEDHPMLSWAVDPWISDIKFQPAKQQGQPIRTLAILPFEFRLQ